MLTKDQLNRLNEHVTEEASASRFYLAISCWAISEGLDGVGQFFRNHHENEEEHMHKLMGYILETGGKVLVGKIDAQPQEFESISKALELSLEREQEVSRMINDTADMFLSQKDYSTYNFLQWYVAEQHEEEHLFRTLIDKAKMIGEDGRGKFWIDKELAKAAASTVVTHSK